MSITQSKPIVKDYTSELSKLGVKRFYFVPMTADKVPVLKQWNSEPLPTDVLFRRYPRNGFSVHPRFSGFAVLDVDGGDWTFIIAKYPPLAYMETPRGAHLYYLLDRTFKTMHRWQFMDCKVDLLVNNYAEVKDAEYIRRLLAIDRNDDNAIPASELRTAIKSLGIDLKKSATYGQLTVASDELENSSILLTVSCPRVAPRKSSQYNQQIPIGERHEAHFTLLSQYANAEARQTHKEDDKWYDKVDAESDRLYQLFEQSDDHPYTLEKANLQRDRIKGWTLGSYRYWNSDNGDSELHIQEKKDAISLHRRNVPVSDIAAEFKRSEKTINRWLDGDETIAAERRIRKERRVEAAGRDVLIKTDWATGDYTKRALGRKYEVSEAQIRRILN